MPHRYLRNTLKSHQASLAAKGYPRFTRQMSGSSETYALMAFPRHVPMQNYIQVSNHSNFRTTMTLTTSVYLVPPRSYHVRWLFKVRARLVSQSRYPSDSVLIFHSDVLSFYKEEMAGETVNYISVLARSKDVSNMQAFQQLADEVARVDASVCEILEIDPEALDAWVKFKDGYVRFHTSFDRYRLDELMNI